MTEILLTGALINSINQQYVLSKNKKEEKFTLVKSVMSTNVGTGIRILILLRLFLNNIEQIKKNVNKVLNNFGNIMENGALILLQMSKCSILHKIFKYVVFQRHPRRYYGVMG